MLRGLRKTAVPPRNLWPHGADFRTSAMRTVRFLVNATGIGPEARVLDVGCGTGRLALGFKEHLGPSGRYVGFDVNAKALRWARRHIGRRDARVHFQHVDVYNGSYNPGGSIAPVDFRFPVPSDSFDVVVLYSVFTHMVTKDVRHYLDEIVRVLVPGGTCVATFYLIDSPQVVKTGNQSFDFRHRMGDFFTADPEVPERAIGYPEDVVKAMYGHVGMVVRHIDYGRWRGNTTAHSWQDAVVAVTAPSEARPDAAGGTPVDRETPA